MIAASAIGGAACSSAMSSRSASSIGLALAGLVRLAVRAEHHAVPDVLGDHVVGQPAGQPADREHLGEVVALPGVGHVDDPVGVQVADPVPDGGQVGDRVAVAAVGLAHDHRRVEALDEDAPAHPRRPPRRRWPPARRPPRRGRRCRSTRPPGRSSVSLTFSRAYAALNPVERDVDQVAPDAPGSARRRTAARPPGCGPGRRSRCPRGTGRSPACRESSASGRVSAEASMPSSRICSTSIPNWVPQSPMWFCGDAPGGRRRSAPG